LENTAQFQSQARKPQALGEELAVIVPAWKERELMIVGSPLGYYGGVLGAAAAAMEDCSASREAWPD
jgi:hypothetical protein